MPASSGGNNHKAGYTPPAPKSEKGISLPRALATRTTCQVWEGGPHYLPQEDLQQQTHTR